MNLLDTLDTSAKVLSARFLGKRAPIIVSWHLTYRCNIECSYCGFWERKTAELETSGVLHLIDELAMSGTKFISFTGGEPFLRKDLGEIIDACALRNIHTSINTNGLLLKKQFEKIKNADEIQISLDSPGELNDTVRKKSDYERVVEAILFCKGEGKNMKVSSVISKKNYAQVNHMLEFADKHKIGVYFHPADQNHSGDGKKHIPDLCTAEQFQEAITTIIHAQKTGHRYINNSLAGLEHLSHWPKSKKIFCFLKLIGCFIEPDGSIFICNNFANYEKYIVPVTDNFKESFDGMRLPHACEQCWCGPVVDLNMMGQFNPESLIQAWNRYNLNHVQKNSAI